MTTLPCKGVAGKDYYRSTCTVYERVFRARGLDVVLGWEGQAEGGGGAFLGFW